MVRRAGVLRANAWWRLTIREMARPGRLELPTLCLEGAQYKILSAASGVAYKQTRHLSRS